MSWKIEYWDSDRKTSSIEKWLDQRTEEQLVAISEELTLLKRLGNGLQLPHSKALGKGLFELRERRYGYRMYYMFHKNKIILIVAAGDKQSQKKDIKLAQSRVEKIKGDKQ